MTITNDFSTNDMELALSSKDMDRGWHKDQEAKYEKVHAGPEVPYTVQTHLISTLLCKLVSRRRRRGISYGRGLNS